MVLNKRFLILGVYLLLSCILLFVSGCDSAGVGLYESSDLSTYKNFGVPTGGGSADIRVFPENLDNIQTINSYYYSANFPSWGRTSWEVVLDVKYNEEDFYMELERLENYEDQNSSKRKLKLDKDCVLFNYPTYIVEYDGRYDYGQVYNYISIDEDNLRIIYIYINCPSRKNQKRHQYEIKLSSIYLPKNFYKNQDSTTLDGYYYSIYTTLEDKLIWFD
ncbi:MAG: hypothetical protein M0Q88_01315 [Bacilli bacterium]|nr:hypothetical protein [Bacilli bacterium]